MNIQILHMIEGARQARGITVIIDVFRAYSVEVYATAAGMEKIIPLADVEQAFRMKEADPTRILAGERGGAKVEGFDFGNSPSQMEGLDFTGKTMIHTTSAGTQGIANAVHADEILAGSLVNAKATADYIRRKNPENVSLVCMGLNAVKQTEEDNLCAEYLKALLEDRTMDLTGAIENLKVTSGAKFFDPKQRSVFPQRDFELCVMVDRFDFVLRLENEDGLRVMKRVK